MASYILIRENSLTEKKTLALNAAENTTLLSVTESIFS